ncbi:MAG: glycosyltransferase [Elusimicrobiales bacterium]|jgi:hypothetical protein
MIYFLNPHYADFYGTSVFNALTGRFSHRKYWFISRYILEKPEKGVGILINLRQNSFALAFVYKIPFLNRLVTLFELAAWFMINRINPFKIPVRFSAASLTKDDIVFIFAFDNLQRPANLIKEISGSPCVKVAHLTHYFLHTSQISRHAEKISKLFFAAESNLSKYPYFKEYFPFYKKDAYLLPFIPQPRFTRRTPFSERRRKCLALGTLTLLSRTPETRDFMDFFHADCIHPMRRAIYENRDRVAQFIDSGVNLYNTDAPVKDVHSQQQAVKKVYYGLWNLFKSRRKTYFSFSAADRFNQYAMVVIPEEINNLPGVSWVESMACGSAYIGLDDPMYTDLGLTPGKHYIAYDNTLQGLLDVVKYYQRNPDALERIAENGWKFVSERLNGPRAASLFLSDLRNLAAQAAAKIPPERMTFHSSFTKAER